MTAEGSPIDWNAVVLVVPGLSASSVRSFQFASACCDPVGVLGWAVVDHALQLIGDRGACALDVHIAADLFSEGLVSFGGTEKSGRANGNRCSSLNVMYRRSCARYRAFVIGRGWQATVFLLAVDGIVGALEGSN